MKENRYCSIILKKLIEKYERRYFHSSSFERNISFNFNEKELPDYVNEDSYLYIFDIITLTICFCEVENEKDSYKLF